MYLFPSFRLLAHRTTALAAVLALFLLLPVGAAWAQVTTSTLSGTVEDATGAVIPGAAVSIKNTKNNFVRKTLANDRGVFSFPSIDSGDYNLTVTYPGFTTYVEKGIHLDPQDSRTISDIKMKAGAITETITVQAPQSTLDTGERSSIITSEDIARLSTEGRDVSELLKILPGSAIAVQGLSQNNGGASNVSGYTGEQTQIGGGSGAYSMNGSPTNGVSIRSDGANLDDPGSYSGATQNINMDMVAEVKVSQSNFGADTANGPIVINAVGKAGGAQYHGSIYTYARTSQLNSTDALANTLQQTKPGDRYVYPGFNVGGPVRVPFLKNFNHDNKLTFFGGAEDYAQRDAYAYGGASSAILHALVPTKGMREGDFSPAQITAYLGAPAVTCSSISCITNAGYTQYNSIVTVPQTGYNGTPLVGGSIAGFQDPGAMALINQLPLPNRVNQGDGFNYITTNLINNDLWQARGRLDLAATENDKFYLVYNVERGKNGIPQSPFYAPSGNSGGANTPGGLIEEHNSQSESFNWTHIISKSTTNEFFASLSYYLQNFVPKQAALLQAAGIGYPYKEAYDNGSTDYPELQDYGFDGLPLGLYPDFSSLPRGFFAKKFTPGIGDNFTKIAGRHSIKVGINIERATNNEVYPNQDPNGGIENYYIPPTFQVTNAQAPGSKGATYYAACYVAQQGGCAGTNNNLATFEEGEIFIYTQSNFDPAFDTYWWNTSLFYSDDWKIRPNVTLTYGLRLEHLGYWNDAHGVGAAIWNPATANNTPSTGATPDQNTLPGFLWHQIDKHLPVSGVSSRLAYLEPRLGVSWDIRGNGKTVLRGGYGQYRYHDNWNDVAQTLASSYGVRNLILPTTGSGDTLASVGTQHLPINQGLFPGSVAALDPHDTQEPMTATYSVTLSRQLKWNSFLELAYVGNDSKYVLNDGSNQSINVDNVNAIPIGAYYAPPPDGRPNPCATLYTPVTDPYNGICTVTQVESISAVQAQQFRPYPNYQEIQVLSHKLRANYNGFQATYNKQKGKATYQINYTFSKALGDHGGFSNGIPADAFNLNHDYGPLSYDRSHIFNASYSYDFGTAYHGNRVLQQVVNNWLISGITGFQSGPNLQAANYNSNFGTGGSINPGTGGSVPVSNSVFLGTPDVQLQPLVICDPRKNLAKHQYMNGACFQLPQLSEQNGQFHYQNGPFVYPYVHGPAYFNTDLTAAKDIHLTEKQSLQFRVAAFNFINHPITTFVGSFPSQFQLNFQNQSNTNPASAQIPANFGIAPYKVGRRVVELALKYFF